MLKIMAWMPDKAMNHYITIAENVNLRSLPLMTFDLGGHFRSLRGYLPSNTIFNIRNTVSILDYNVSKYCPTLKMTFN